MTDLDPLAVHESGHTCVSHALGRALGPVGIRDGAGIALAYPRLLTQLETAGLDMESPVSLWPPEVVARFAGDILALMGGETAQLLLCAPAEGRVQDPVSERAAVLVADAPAVIATLEPLSEADDLELTYYLDRPGCSDAEAIAQVAHMLHGDDLASSSAHLSFLRAQCAAIVMQRRSDITRLAAMISQAGSMSGAAVAAFLNRPEASDA